MKKLLFLALAGAAAVIAKKKMDAESAGASEWVKATDPVRPTN